MAKYITLDGLNTFLTKLKNSVCVKLKTNGGLVADSNGLGVKLKLGGGLRSLEDGLSVNPNNKLAMGPTLTKELNPVEIGTQITNFDFTMEPHQLTYIDLYEHTHANDADEEVCESLSSITLLGFNNEASTLSTFDHTTQYFLQIKLGTKPCEFKTYSSNNTQNKPKIYWADGLVLGSLVENSVYEVVFTRQLQDSTHLTAAWTQFK
jgi:hypothetical protein